MSKREFKFPTQYPTIQKTIRFPEDLTKDIEDLIKGRHCTFTAFVVEAVRTVVNELKDQEQ